MFGLTPFQSFFVFGALTGLLLMFTVWCWHVWRYHSSYRTLPRAARHWFGELWQSAFACVIVFGLASSLFTGPFFYDFVGDNTVFFTHDGEVLYVADGWMSMWHSDALLQPGVLRALQCTGLITNSADDCGPNKTEHSPPAPISANPHVVRHLHIIEVRRELGVEAAVALRLKELEYGSTSTFIKYLIGEMNKDLSQPLSEMDNLYAPGVQEQYEALVREYMEFQLREAGLVLVFTEIDEPQPRTGWR